MFGLTRSVELAQGLLHIGALSGAATHIAEGDSGGALAITIIASICVLIITGAVALAEIGKVKVRQYMRKHDQHFPKRHAKEEQDV
jgi:hypothetical protein